MKNNMAGVLADAWAMWKSDRDLLVRIAGLIFFLPRFAVLVLTPSFVAPPAFPGFEAKEAALQSYTAASQQWFLTYGTGPVLISLITLFGVLAATILYLGNHRPDTRAALGTAIRLLPRYILVAILLALPLELFVKASPLLILPALYLAGRLLLVTPAFVAEQPIGILATFRRSWTSTQGLGLSLTGVACIAIFGGFLFALPLALIGTSLDGAPMANPVVAVIIDAGTAAILSAGVVAAILIQVALYRRLASRPVSNMGI